MNDYVILYKLYWGFEKRYRYLKKIPIVFV